MLIDPHVSYYSETSYRQYDGNVVNASKVAIDWARLLDATAYVGASIDQDTRSDNISVFNDNSVSPLAGVRAPVLVPDLAVFAEYRQNFRIVNRADFHSKSEGDFRAGLYGYRYWDLARVAAKTSLFQEGYGEWITRSKLDWQMGAAAWSKTGMRWMSLMPVSLDAYLGAELKRSSGFGLEDNLQSFGPGARASLRLSRFVASLAMQREIGSYAKNPGDLSRWKTLFVLNGEF